MSDVGSNTTAGTTTGATIGTALGGPAGAAVGAAIGAAFGFLSSIVPALFKSGTKHMDVSQANSAVGTFWDPIWNQIQTGVSNLSQFNSDLRNAVLNFMSNSTWWSQGNDVAGRTGLMNTIVNGLGVADYGHGSVFILLRWIFQDSPADNPKEAFNWSEQAFQTVLYPLLNQYGASNLALAISQQMQQTGQTATTTTGTAPTTGTNIWDQLFGPKTSPTTTTTKTTSASLFSNPIVVLLLVGVGVTVLFGKKIRSAIA